MFSGSRSRQARCLWREMRIYEKVCWKVCGQFICPSTSWFRPKICNHVHLLKCWMMALVARPYNDLGDEPIPSILRSNASHFSIWTRWIWCTVSSISEKSLASQVGSFLVLCNGRPIWDVRIKQKKNNIISKPLSCQSWRNRNQLFLHQTWENFETYFLNLSGLQCSDQALVNFSRWQ